GAREVDCRHIAVRIAEESVVLPRAHIAAYDLSLFIDVESKGSRGSRHVEGGQDGRIDKPFDRRAPRDCGAGNGSGISAGRECDACCGEAAELQPWYVHACPPLVWDGRHPIRRSCPPSGGVVNSEPILSFPSVLAQGG